MSDLIRRSALLKIFDHDLKCFETNGKTEAEMYISVADMRKMINEQPTAYDVEKVVAELEKQGDIAILNAPNTSDMYNADYQKWMMKYYGFQEAIDIVRKGGVE